MTTTTMTTATWKDADHHGKPWTVLKRGAGVLWLWHGTPTEALEACASPSGAKKIEARSTVGLLVEPKLEAVLELARAGWADGMALAKAAAGMPAIASPWPTRVVFDVYGDEPDIAAFAAGIPENMIQWQEESHRGVGTAYQDIVQTVCASWYAKPEVLAYVAALGISAVDVLEAGGVRCRVRVVAASSRGQEAGIMLGQNDDALARIQKGLERRTGFLASIAVKDWQDPLSEAGTIFWLGHPAVLRGVIFGLAGGAQGLEYDVGESLGIPIRALQGDPRMYPRGGWDQGAIGMTWQEGSYAAPSVLCSLLSLSATIGRWMGRDAALAWLEHVERLSLAGDGELGRWLDVVRRRMREELRAFVTGVGDVRYEHWRELASAAGASLGDGYSVPLDEVYAFVRACVAKALPEEAWGWQSHGH